MLAGTNDLPDAILTDSGLKITPLDASVPQAAQRLIDQVAASLPHIKITDLLLEVDTWTGYTAHFTHLKSGDAAKDRNVGVRDSTYVLDGLLHHESDLRLEEHYTDTAGFTDHVFALMHLLGFRFAPRIRDLSDTKLYLPNSKIKNRALAPMIGGTINLRAIRTHWNEILRLAASIRQGTMTASLMLRKLGSYPRQNGLAVALRELGRIERTLFILSWLQSVELRRRVHAGLNKGEARNASPGPSSSAASARSGTAASSSNATERVASPSSRPQSHSGTPST